MKLFYILTFLFGCLMIVLLQVVEVAKSRDAIVAGVLSRSPDSWTLTLDDGMKNHLSGYDVKKEVDVALQKRHSYHQDDYLEILCIGGGVIMFSLIGLTREVKIDRMRKLIEHATAVSSAAAS
jgi:hypothetical protein